MTVRSDIAVEGMTCAACSNRIQRTLTKLDGVESAQVNFANGRATVLHDPAVDDAQLRAAIERLGYQAPETSDHDGAERRREDPSESPLAAAQSNASTSIQP